MAWRWLLWAVAAGVLSACASSARAPVGDRTVNPTRHPDYHTVRQGDTLYSVAFLYGYSVDDIAAWNGLQAPYTIYKRQRLRLSPPPPGRKAVPRPAPVNVTASRPKPRTGTAPVPVSKPKTALKPAPRSVPKPASASVPKAAPRRHEPAPAANARVTWTWPADGTLIKRYSASGSGKKGIDIAGKNGQSVRAAASGKVVYSGSGLSGYGRLIILKHNKDFLSAYAHNRKLIAREGQWVKKGEVIAQMGSSGTDRIKLHFEIRKRGKPVDPLRYLPRR